jgi:hypothetical protein
VPPSLELASAAVVLVLVSAGTAVLVPDSAVVMSAPVLVSTRADAAVSSAHPTRAAATVIASLRIDFAMRPIVERRHRDDAPRENGGPVAEPAVVYSFLRSPFFGDHRTLGLIATRGRSRGRISTGQRERLTEVKRSSAQPSNSARAITSFWISLVPS